MEDKSTSSSTVSGSVYVQSDGNDDRAQFPLFDGGGNGFGNGELADTRSESGAMSLRRCVDIGDRLFNENATSMPRGPEESWLEFTEWLERSLDDCGLEPNLYARCVLSILKQQPEPAADTSVDRFDEWAPDSSTNLSINRHYVGKIASAPSSRKNSFGSLASAAALVNAKTDQDARKQALLDCLKTVNGDEGDLRKFVDDIIHRYASVAKPGTLGEKQNESVDSGVCPSPEESFQNYDEAFPPLANERSGDVFIGDDVAIRPRGSSASWLNGKRPAEVITSIASNFIPTNALDDGNIDGRTLINGSQVESSPVKRLKLNFETTEAENGGRSLRSCPDFVHSSADKRATFCCPVVKKQNSSQIQSTAGCKIQPQFVVPKCWKVGSWPSRYDRSTKPAGDVPFWSCSEWFCTVHKRLEFGLLNAKINGDTKSLAPPSTAATVGSDRPPSAMMLDTVAQNMASYVDVDIFEIDPPFQPPPQQHHQQHQQQWNSAVQTQSDREQPYAVPEMFDAPRFILHIINEDDAMVKEHVQQQDKTITRPEEKDLIYSSDWMLFGQPNNAADDTQYPNNNAASIGPFDNAIKQSWMSADFQSDTEGNGNAEATSVFPVEGPRLGQTEIGFCLPKFGRFPAVLNQQQRQQPSIGNQNAAIGMFNKLLENAAVDFQENAKLKQQPQSVAVPITDHTHFIPIRSESMEDAYFLKPGFDEVCAAIDNIEDYYVYQESGGNGTVVVSAATTILKEKAAGEKQRRSLALKFRASNPDKMCQTEIENAAEIAFDYLSETDGSRRASSTMLDSNQWYSQEFEIWAFQPTEELKPTANRAKWAEDLPDDCDDMVVGPLSPQIDDAWLNGLVEEEKPAEYQRQPMEEPNNVGVIGSKQPVSTDGQQQLDIWQQEDERYEDSLLRYVSNISLISPLDIQTTTV